ncbi:hypothetical protein [Dehalobacterium formicoaceticum]|uniref:Uncharacterized protein n=1 Tax=Dehalobacterium formicoaceticum TaxID=51515 RepID=A0ABT1Y669_9FIRM|nr:hypothetical protein [Dehalobacterium formicoaceticum]MCR6546038.1 hypothetical protein [Dehalobacterium formicoaceticum]
MIKNTPEKNDIMNMNHQGKPECQDDYVFRFKIEPKNQDSNPDTLLGEFYSEQIKDLLKIVFFSRDGEKLIPNEFGFLNEPDKKYPIKCTE